MPVLNQWIMHITLDQILTALGVDPRRFETRKPAIQTVAQKALEVGSQFLDPQVVYERYEVFQSQNNRIHLGENVWIGGQEIFEELHQASALVIGVATLGNRFDQFAKADSIIDLPFRLALDGLGTAALDDLLTQLCQHIAQISQGDHQYTSIPLSPGMAGWDTGIGQEQIFQLVDASQIGVTLNEARMMIPRMSCSFVIGLSKYPFTGYEKCEFCGARSRCTYQRDTRNA